MENWNRYFVLNQEEQRWGLTTHNAGYTDITPDATYPSRTHPEAYYFSYERGRVIDEYQLVYITRGSGVFESATAGCVDIKAGTVFLLFPGEWHRYKPDERTGWEEYWIGMNGPYLDYLLREKLISAEAPCYEIGVNEALLQIFDQLIIELKNESVTYQYLASGLVLQILGLVLAAKQGVLTNAKDYTQATIGKAKQLLNEDYKLGPEEVADRLAVGYSWFRKNFKRYTGFSPKQYVLELRLNRVKRLIQTTNLSMKQIALETGFDSPYYFSKMFRKKTGVSPSEYRKALMFKN